MSSSRYLKLFIPLKVFILAMLILALVMTVTMATTAQDVKDDDCMDIAMRPLPRFGKRSSDLNQETVNRLKRSCIINRRQSKAVLTSLLKNPLISNEYGEYLSPSSIFGLSSLRKHPSWWKNLLEQLNEQRDILDKIMNRNIRRDMSIRNVDNSNENDLFLDGYFMKSLNNNQQQWKNYPVYNNQRQQKFDMSPIHSTTMQTVPFVRTK